MLVIFKRYALSPLCSRAVYQLCHQSIYAGKFTSLTHASYTNLSTLSATHAVCASFGQGCEKEDQGIQIDEANDVRFKNSANEEKSSRFTYPFCVYVVLITRPQKYLDYTDPIAAFRPQPATYNDIDHSNQTHRFPRKTMITQI